MPIGSYIRALLFLMVFFSGGCDNGSDIPVIDFSRTIPKKMDHQQLAGPELRVAVAAMISPEETYLLYNRLLQYIGRGTGRRVVFVQRKTYQEVNDLLRKGRIDLAFICSGPYATHRGKGGFQVLATPVVRGSPLYRAYLIVNKDSQVADLGQLRGKVFAFTDPESNTGRLVPLYWLGEMGERPDEFFGKYIFTYSHSNSLVAVSRSLVDGASVDGLVWDYFSVMSPARVAQTRIIKRSRAFGNPPLVVSSTMPLVLKSQIEKLIFSLNDDEEGRKILHKLMVDKFVRPNEKWYKPIQQMARALAKQRGPEHVFQDSQR